MLNLKQLIHHRRVHDTARAKGRRHRQRSIIHISRSSRETEQRNGYNNNNRLKSYRRARMRDQPCGDGREPTASAASAERCSLSFVFGHLVLLLELAVEVVVCQVEVALGHRHAQCHPEPHRDGPRLALEQHQREQPAKPDPHPWRRSGRSGARGARRG